MQAGIVAPMHQKLKILCYVGQKSNKNLLSKNCLLGL